ncbi:competence protein ComK [Lysinibacillus sp. 3P01SB]|uniref:competence protein ComK n=1 Tax=Lysinibacillus sp. 3P01SB TaxID=3132284 RepID=UPI0039A6BC85
MKKKVEFQITEETKKISPFREKGTGELHSIVLHGNDFLHLPAPPYEIVDYNLRRFGSSLRGAKDSAKEILGTSSMFPVALGKENEWIWFMTEAMKNEQCTWFALHHVNKLIPVDKERTKVLLYCGYEEEIHISACSLNNRRNRGHLFQSKLLQNTYPHPFLYSSPTENFGMVSEGDSVQYEVKKPNPDEKQK